MAKEFDELEMQEAASVALLVKVEKCYNANQKKIVPGLELKGAIRYAFKQLGVSQTTGAAPAGRLENKLSWQKQRTRIFWGILSMNLFWTDDTDGLTP